MWRTKIASQVMKRTEVVIDIAIAMTYFVSNAPETANCGRSRGQSAFIWVILCGEEYGNRSALADF
jgi:hypothetical protein